MVAPRTAAPSFASSYDWSSQARSPWRLLFRALVAGWILLVLAALLLGSRPSTLERLEAQVAAGEVRDVRVAGQELEPGVRGFATVDVHWRDRLGGHVATVIEVRPRNQDLQGVDLVEGTAVITGTVAERLTAQQPGLRVIHVDRSGSSALGWQLPSWIVWSSFALYFVTLGLVILGPQPWRASRWAWFWLLTTGAPFGLAAFLLLGGPAPLVPAPRTPERVLTGGWAFLLALLLSAVNVWLGSVG